MADFDFDRVIDRRATDSNKWRKFPADVLPLWVADMDFPSPPVVVNALHARVEQGFFGYLTEHNDLPEVVAERVAKRYGWRVSPEAVVALPGVIAGFNQALRALTSPGQGLLVQTPIYPPFVGSVAKQGRRLDENPLALGAGVYTIDLDHLRRTTDATRGILEKTRGDLTLDLRKEALSSALRAAEASVGRAK